MAARTTMNALELLTLAAALGSGLGAGFFFAFSICIMKALGKVPAPQGIAAMQAINVVVINPWFLSVFFGTAVLCVLAIVASLMRWQDPRAAYLLLGGVLYIVGTILVTMLFNVPRNNALAAVSPASTEAGALWLNYLSSWTAWNHVRTIAALLAALLFTLAFRLRPWSEG
jgi:uncharacterized membrane protein